MIKDSAVAACVASLESRLTGELRSDPYSRMLYSTDASIYQVDPLAVVIPRDREDVHAVVEAAAEFGVPLLPRTSGSSLAGQAVGEAIVIDFTRHLDQIVNIDADAKTVTVEPGVILGSLNAELLGIGLQFGPDPASANRAAIGGVVGNNATGAHSILYGMTADHVREMNVILSDGSRARFGASETVDVPVESASTSLEPVVTAGIVDLISNPDHIRMIEKGTPRHWRRCGGYNLDRLIDGNVSFRLQQEHPFNLARLVCGSEGTLAVIEDVTLDLVPVPVMTALAIVHFDELHAALKAVNVILETNPSAVELLDHLGMSLCRKVPAWRKKLEGFVEGDPECVLITEYYGESESELRSKIEALSKRISAAGTGAKAIVKVTSSAGQADVWGVRKMGLGFLMSVRGDYKPIPFIEDAAVPTEHLAEYVIGVEDFCKSIDTQVAYYAHASAGCVHIRPLVNTKAASEISKLSEITSFAIELLHGFGGSLSSEHGDGRARSAFNEQFFGPDLYGLYRSVKQLFDPGNLFNPGNIVEAGPMTENLRYGPSYNTAPVKTHLDFSDGGGFAGAVEMCNGAGVCRKLGDATMCPSFMATRDEEHSTRGRANALRAVLSGRVQAEGLGDRRLFETMDLCLECKACVSECPSAVDMAKLKMEFLAQYQDTHGIPIRSKLFGGIARSSRRAAGSRARFVNAALGNRAAKWALDKSIGVTRKRPLPPFATVPFTKWFERHDKPAASKGRVVLFNDTFNTYNYPSVSIAATRFLESCGFEVVLSGHGCCGRPMLSKGMLDEARTLADATLDALVPFAAEGIPIIGLEPSCLLGIGDEYKALFPHDDRVALVADQACLLDEFVCRLDSEDRLSVRFTEERRQIMVHGHCHQKALVGTTSTLRALGKPSNYHVSEIESGCCGMAGSFGYEKEHYDISMKIGEDRLFPAVRRSKDSIVCASGVSCRQQIEHGTGKQVFHPAELLWDAVRNQD